MSILSILASAMPPRLYAPGQLPLGESSGDQPDLDCKKQGYFRSAIWALD